MNKRTRISHSHQKRSFVNRSHKDLLFQFLFRDKRDLLELYNAVNGTDYQNPDDLVITTLEDVVFLGMKNDLSFIIGATLNLYEHQSTWNANMPLRGLLYFASLYQTYITQYGYNLYGSKKIELPFPVYLVFYNGSKNMPEEQELLLSDAFWKTGRNPDPAVECRVRMLNINKGHNHNLMKKCRRLGEYAEFIGRIKDHLQAGKELEDAVRTAMDDCISRGILADILSRCQKEVLHMLLAEYNEKETMDYIRRESQEIGRKIGKREATKRINKLNCLLIAGHRYDELERASRDAGYQKKLFRIYGI